MRQRCGRRDVTGRKCGRTGGAAREQAGGSVEPHKGSTVGVGWRGRTGSGAVVGNAGRVSMNGSSVGLGRLKAYVANPQARPGTYAGGSARRARRAACRERRRVVVTRVVRRGAACPVCPRCCYQTMRSTYSAQAARQVKSGNVPYEMSHGSNNPQAGAKNGVVGKCGVVYTGRLRHAARQAG